MSSAPQDSSRALTRRVLVCTPFTPRLDARHGGKATAQLLLRLAERNEIALLCLRAPGEDPVDPATLRRDRGLRRARSSRRPALGRWRLPPHDSARGRGPCKAP